MKIIRRYILSNTLIPFAGSIVVFTLLLLLLRLVKIAEMVLVRGADPVEVLKLLMWLSVYLLTYTIPISMLIAITLTFGRLSTDNELMAFKASGISLRTVLTPIIWFGMLLSIFCIELNCNILPVMHKKIAQTIYSIGTRKPSSLLTPGVFVRFFENYTIYINQIKDDNVYDVKIYEILPSGTTKVIIADSGTIAATEEDGTISMHLKNGRIDQQDSAGQTKYMSLKFDEYEIKLRIRNKRKGGSRAETMKGLKFKELTARIKEFDAQGADSMPARMELHTRIALSFGALVFIAAGLAFSLTTRRKEKSINFAYSVAVIVLYYVLSAGGVAASITNKIPAVVCAWSANIIIGAAGLIVLSMRRE